MEKKAGIIKDYQTITEKSQKSFASTRNRPFTTANLIRNRRLMSQKTKERKQTAATNAGRFRDSRKLSTPALSIHSKSKHGVFVDDVEGQRADQIISRREDTDRRRVLSKGVEEGDDRTIDRRNVEDLEGISSHDGKLFGSMGLHTSSI